LALSDVLRGLPKTCDLRGFHPASALIEKDLFIASSPDAHRRMLESAGDFGLEGHVLRRGGFVAGCFRRLPFASSVAIALGIEKLDFVSVDKIPIALSASLFVVPGLGALAAFEVDATAFIFQTSASAKATGR